MRNDKNIAVIIMCHLHVHDRKKNMRCACARWVPRQQERQEVPRSFFKIEGNVTERWYEFLNVEKHNCEICFSSLEIFGEDA